jgi:hypothetical protein
MDYGIPYEATRGGPETMYPEYREKLKTLPPPAKPAPATSRASNAAKSSSRRLALACAGTRHDFSAAAERSLAGVGTIPGSNPNGPIRVLPVRGNIYVLMGGGANITLSVGLEVC